MSVRVDELIQAKPAKSLLPGLSLAAAGAIAFSGKAILVKLSYRYGVDAVTLIMYRMLFALPLFAALAWWTGRGKPALAARDVRAILVLGFTGYYLSSFLDFAGLQYVTAGLERLILYLSPTVVLLLGRVFLKQQIGGKQWGALALSYFGIVVVFAHGVAVGEGTLLGVALVFASAVSYSVYLILCGQAVRRLGAVRLTGLATSVACVLCIAQFLVLRPIAAAAVAPPVIWLSVLNAMLGTFVPVLLVTMAIERIGAALTAQVGMIGPLSTVVLGIVILGEPFTGWIVAGTALVMGGVWLLSRVRQGPA